MDLLTIITILIIISAAFSYINLRLLKLPSTIGVITISVFVSLIILIIGKIGSSKANLITKLANNIDFSSLLLNVLLGLLLFATALHFDYKKLKELRRPIIVLSTVGVLVSTAVFGLLFYEAGLILHTPVPLIYCFVFGALVSPQEEKKSFHLLYLPLFSQGHFQLNWLKVKWFVVLGSGQFYRSLPSRDYLKSFRKFWYDWLIFHLLHCSYITIFKLRNILLKSTLHRHSQPV